MPPITVHMVLAQRIADDLGDARIDAHRGPYLLGSTSPDIRVLTRWPRVRTHCFDLDCMDPQDSVGAFLRQHPELAQPAELNDATVAFMAGYVSHLVMDEQYITTIYRPVFLDHGSLGGPVRANVMDRLLQFDMDREHGSDPRVKQRLTTALAEPPDAIECGIIDRETLDRWRIVCTDVARRGMDWDRARSMIQNHLRGSGIDQPDELAALLDQLPELRRETRDYVSDAEVEAFIERATTTATDAIERYLACE